MAAIQRIDSLYDVSSITKEQETLIEQLKTILATMKDVQAGINSMGNSKGGTGLAAANNELIKSQTDLQNELIKTEKVLQAKLRTEQETIKVIQAEAKATAEETRANIASERAKQEQIKTEKQSLQYKIAVEKEKLRGISTSQAEANIAFKAANEYLNLSKALQDAEIKYKNLYLTQGSGNEQTQMALKNALSIRAVLDTVDQSLGNHQRNVGNYASGFNGLNMSIQQILRETPSAAVSLNTFFLAISNNLPIFFDEIAKLQKAQAAANAEAKAAAILAKEQAIATAMQAGATAEAAAAEGILAEQTILANSAQKAVPGVLKQIFGSLFSLQSALTLSVLLLTLFGSQLFAAVPKLFNAKKATDDLKKSNDGLAVTIETLEANYKNLNDVIADSNKNAGKQTADLKILYGAATDVNLAIKDRREAVEGLQKEFPDYFGNIKAETILNGQASAAYDKVRDSIIEVARATAAKSKIDELERQRLDIFFQKQKIESATAAEKARAKDQTFNTIGVGGFATGASTQSGLTTKAEAQAIIEKRRLKAIREQDLKDQSLAQQEAFLINYVGEKNIVKVVEDASKEKKGKKVKDIKDIGDAVDELRKELATIDNLQKIGEITPTDADIDRVKAYDKAFKAIFDLGGKASTPIVQTLVLELNPISRRVLEAQIHEIVSKVKKLKDDISEPIPGPKIEFGNSYAEGEAKFYEGIAARQVTVLETQSENEQTALTKRFNEGKISREEYEKELYDIQSKYAKQSFQEQINWLQKEVDLLPAGTKAREDAEKKLADLQLKLNQTVSEDRQKKLDLLVKHLEEFQSMFNAALNFIDGLQNASITSQKNALSDLEASQQKTYDANVERVTNSGALEADKTRELSRLEIQRQAQKEQNETRQRQLDLQRAKFEKAQAIATIVLQTAVAIANSLTNPFQLALAIALGAAQLAVAIATPLPRFAVGTDNAPEGFAYVGEKGPEGRVEPDGSTSITPGKPTLTWLKKGTKIIPNNRLNKILPEAAMGDVPRFKAEPTMKDFTTVITQSMDNQTNEIKTGFQKLNKKRSSFSVTNKIETNWGSYLGRKVFNK